MRPFRQPLLAATLALSLAACGSPESVSSPAVDTRTPAQREAERTPYVLDEAFARAAQEFQVPAELLKAIAYTETRFEMIQGGQEFEGMPSASGLMALRGEQLVEGARLAGVTLEEARLRPEANIRAAAALLSGYARQAGLAREDVGAWAPVVVKLSGISHAEAQAQYVHRQVYGVMRSGVVAHTPEGAVAVSLTPREVQARFASPGVRAMADAGPDYAPAVWRPSPNYNARPTGSLGGVQVIVIHTCESSYESCWSWLVKSSGSAAVSAHYVVNESGSEISQLVREADRGWHVGASYDSALNGKQMTHLQGSSVNNFAVGIEHGGSASQTTFPAGQLEASAKLTANIAVDNKVPRDEYHIVGHGKLQPYNRTDPGANWPWKEYLARVRTLAGDEIIIDSNNANNDIERGKLEPLSASWISVTSSSTAYGSGFWYASTQAVSDPATFSFYLPEPATRTIEAWWTAGTNRSSVAPFLILDAKDVQLGKVVVNQQASGGQWNTLGTYSFPAGWNKVQLSRWTTTGSIVVADAIRVR